MKVFFCHGLESGPVGKKSIAMREAGFDLQTPDFRGLLLAKRIELLLELLKKETQPLLLVGSSYGGLTALLASQMLSNASSLVHGMILCAPALWQKEEPACSMDFEIKIPTIVIHGRNDNVVPIEVAKVIQHYPLVKWLEVEDDHSLGASIPLILQEIKNMITRKDPI